MLGALRSDNGDVALFETREIEQNAYAKFLTDNKQYYSIFEKGLFKTTYQRAYEKCYTCHITRQYYLFWSVPCRN